MSTLMPWPPVDPYQGLLRRDPRARIRLDPAWESTREHDRDGDDVSVLADAAPIVAAVAGGGLLTRIMFWQREDNERAVTTSAKALEAVFKSVEQLRADLDYANGQIRQLRLENAALAAEVSRLVNRRCPHCGESYGHPIHPRPSDP